ncbi:MAG TPA: tripartite tricarboxylate transporter TctB family protein [Usitatibacter sp.]|jgi:putative tricarboxylic transport membrane protein|nr:tripartite tricarboxylate transporter TctB family protein [Usitatibacter sp.]
MKAPAGQVAVAAGITAIGVLVFAGSFYLPTGGGYAQVGPGVVPRVVGAIVMLLGAVLLAEALRGGFPGVDEEAEAKLPMDWAAFAWVSGGILAYGVLIEWLGFVFSSTILFVMVARGFSSKRYALNVVTGLVLASLVFAMFNYGLGLTLPPGVLKAVLP